ncbi:hypothetical protein FM114_11980 [Luteococcus japonicus LSP_Lj1]|uniref:Uncharacterized protein n=1 Tax=Luteococcus japonicus LSP_Lj1 TaxID=1255658 RepID=A0A1R4K7Q9_9ACTN|nr:hypothetical protein FM114_11980 [Luteococcus japonicus LSP_Lj1]
MRPWRWTGAMDGGAVWAITLVGSLILVEMAHRHEVTS